MERRALVADAVGANRRFAVHCSTAFGSLKQLLASTERYVLIRQSRQKNNRTRLHDRVAAPDLCSPNGATSQL